VGAIVLGLCALAAALAAVEAARNLRRRRARDRTVSAGMGDPAARPQAIASLRRELLRVERPPGLLGRRALDREASEIRLTLALLLLVADEPEAALDELVQIDPNRLPKHLQAVLALHAVEAHLRLAEWDAAERVLDGYSDDALNANGRALRQNARAQIRLGRGDARGALRVLDETEPTPEVAPQLAVTRARALAADGQRSDEVWRILSALQPLELERVLERHGGEPVAQAARRILDGQGPYR